MGEDNGDPHGHIDSFLKVENTVKANGGVIRFYHIESIPFFSKG